MARGVGAALALALVLAGMFFVDALEGPALYVYPDSSVYSPGSTVVFRVLAVDADGRPSPNLQLLASVYDPENALLSEVEGETGDDGWFVFSAVVEREGVYSVVVNAVDPSYPSSEAFVLVCSTCPRGGGVVTVTTAVTATFTVGSTVTLKETVTAAAFSTQTVTASEFLTGTVFETVVLETTVFDVVVSTVTSVVVSYGVVTSFVTVVSTREVTSSVVRTVVAESSDGSVFPLVLVAVVLLLLAAVVFYAFRSRV